MWPLMERCAALGLAVSVGRYRPSVRACVRGAQRRLLEQMLAAWWRRRTGGERVLARWLALLLDVCERRLNFWAGRERSDGTLRSGGRGAPFEVAGCKLSSVLAVREGRLAVAAAAVGGEMSECKPVRFSPAACPLREGMCAPARRRHWQWKSHGSPGLARARPLLEWHWHWQPGAWSVGLG